MAFYWTGFTDGILTISAAGLDDATFCVQDKRAYQNIENLEITVKMVINLAEKNMCEINEILSRERLLVCEFTIR